MSEKDQQNRQLTSRQNRAIEALLSGVAKSTAAGVAGVKPRTLSRWFDQPEFNEELRRRSDESIGDATRRLSGTLDLAVTTMRGVMEDVDVPASVRLRAAQVSGDLALRLIEVNQVLSRIERLERKVGI